MSGCCSITSYPRFFRSARSTPDDAAAHWEGPGAFEDKIAAAIEAAPDGIAQVFNVAGVACATADHQEAANCAQNMLAYSVFERTICWTRRAAGR